MNLHYSCGIQLAALLLLVSTRSSILNLAQAQESTRSPSAALLDKDTPCIRPCGLPDITPSILQKCVDLCEEEGHCCGNRLTGEVQGSAATRLSCANGCEMAYYSTNVDQCKQSCSAGFNNGCEYVHPYVSKPFDLCRDCREGCEGWPSDEACNDGCDFATTLDEFYQFEEPSDTCNPTDIPRFLFGGQSNMEGNSAEAMDDQLVQMIDVINSKRIKNVRRKKKKLKNVINAAIDAEAGASKYMRNLLWKMRKRLKPTVLDPPKNGAVCSYTNPSYMLRLDCERPVTPDVCNANGHGPELMFAHHFPTLNTKYKGQTIGITKVARGGSIIKQWMKQYSTDDDNYWDTLVDAIRGSGGTMEGFVWFQGENDNFLNEEERGKYQERLTQFVSDVRDEIFQASSKFQSKDDIPVVIVEVGEWIRGIGGTGPGSIIAAQRAYVDSDPNSILVSSGASENPNKRLSKFYHFDAASQLIIGHRVAEALATLLKESCDDAIQCGCYFECDQLKLDWETQIGQVGNCGYNCIDGIKPDINGVVHPELFLWPENYYQNNESYGYDTGPLNVQGDDKNMFTRCFNACFA